MSELSGVNPGARSNMVEKNGHQSALGTACCRAQPVAAEGDGPSRILILWQTYFHGLRFCSLVSGHL